MAIYHLNVKVISRGKGRKVVAAAAYRRAAKFYDEQCNRTWNYKNKTGVIHSEITVPENSPAWANKVSSEFLWNLVEKSEVRMNSRLAREVEFALPVELTQEQSVLLAREFIKDQFVSQGMVADWSVHWDNPENPHVHVMLTTRKLDQTGFGEKVRAWNDKTLLVTWREKWAEYANFHLKLHQHNIRIDHRSYKNQGIDLIPTMHRGYAVEAMEKRGKKVDRLLDEEQIKADNLKKLDEVIKRIEQNYSVFGSKELWRVLSTYTKDPDVLQAVSEEIKLHSAVMLLGIGDDGEEKYTTKRLFELEKTIQQCTDQLQQRCSKPVSQSFIEKQLSVYEKHHGLQLTEEQRDAINHLMKPQGVSCVVGRAGSGKSFTLGAARHLWEKKGFQMHGITLSGIAAENLQKESNIQSRTIASFKYALLSSQVKLTKKDVVVMDEAGMTDSESMAFILEEVQKSGAKIVLVGDPEQLQPIGSGPIFQAVLQRTGFAEMNRIYRQREAWQREATKNLSLGKVDKALSAYDGNQCIHFDESLVLAKRSVVNRWSELRKENQLSDILVLAHRNADVQELNHLIRKQRLIAGEVDAGEIIHAEKAILNLSKHDRILFTKNDRKMKVKNGQFGTITSIAGNTISVKTDSGKNITFDAALYPYFAYGYAATVHKAQGVTVKHSLVCVAGTYWDKHLSYVALSRHKESCHVFTDKQSYKNIEKLSQQLSRKPLKDSVLDYPLNFAERRGIDVENLIHKIPAYVSEKIKSIRDKFLPREEVLVDLLKNYVDYQVEQKKLIGLIGTTKFNKLEESEKHYEKYRENKEKIKSCVQKIVQYSDVRENFIPANTKLYKLSERGGFNAIAERMSKNQIDPEDIQAVIAEIRAKMTASQSMQIKQKVG